MWLTAPRYFRMLVQVQVPYHNLDDSLMYEVREVAVAQPLMKNKNIIKLLSNIGLNNLTKYYQAYQIMIYK